MRIKAVTCGVGNLGARLFSQGPNPRAPRRRRFSAACTSREEIRCYVNEEGHLVCDRLEPGDYVVKGSSFEEEKEDDSGVAFCYITDSGELVCEGLPEGQYTIERANEDQMKEILSRMEQLTDEDVAPEPIPLEETPKETFDPETGVHCYVNADGVMVCEKLEPGDYVVKTMPDDKGKTISQSGDDRVTFCYITEDGELICEGMEEGTYRIEKATDDDLAAMVENIEKITNTSEN